MIRTRCKPIFVTVLAVLVIFAQALPLHALVYCNMQNATVAACVCDEASDVCEISDPIVEAVSCCSVTPEASTTPALAQGSCCDLQIFSHDFGGNASRLDQRQRPRSKRSNFFSPHGLLLRSKPPPQWRPLRSQGHSPSAFRFSCFDPRLRRNAFSLERRIGSC